MAIVNVRRLGDTSATSDRNFVRTYKVKWRVVVNNVLDDPLSATNTGLLPLKYASYIAPSGAVDIGAVLINYTAERSQKDPKIFIVTADYSSERLSQKVSANPSTLAGGPGGSLSRGDLQEANPLLRPPRIAWGGQKFQEAYEMDESTIQKPVLTTASEPHTPAPARDRTRLTLTMVRNEVTYTPDLAMTFHDKVNDNFIDILGRTFPSGEVKCDLITASSEEEKGVIYYAVTYNFSFRRTRTITQGGGLGLVSIDGWDDVLLNAGFMCLDAGGNRVPCMMRDLAVAVPYPLNAGGHQLAVGADPVYNFFQPYKRIDFKPLNLPTKPLV